MKSFFTARYILLLEVLLLVAIAGLASHYFTFVESAQITASLAVAYAIPRVLYSSREWSCLRGQLVLLVVGAVVCLLAVYSLAHFSVLNGRTLSHPYLCSDDGLYFYWAFSRYHTGYDPNHVAFVGFPLAMLGLWKLLGVSIVWPLAMNVSLTLITLVLVGAITRRLLARRISCYEPHLAALAMAMTGVLMFFLSQGLRIQKEAMVYVTVATCAYVLAGMNSNEEKPAWHWRDQALWAVAVLVLALTRTTYVYLVAMGVVLVCVTYWRANWRPGLLLLASLAVAFAIGNHWANYSVDAHMSFIEGGEVMQRQFITTPSQQPYLELIGNYFFHDIGHRLLLLPLTCSVQYIIPFPWTYSQPTLMELFPRLAWGWYAVGGLAAFYFVMEGFRRRGQTLGAWAWWPILAFVAIGYAVAGSVNRYILPLQPLVVPAAVLVVYRLRQGQWRRPFVWWATGYCLLLMVTLIVCYHIQVDYLNGLNEYYRSLM